MSITDILKNFGNSVIGMLSTVMWADLLSRPLQKMRALWARYSRRRGAQVALLIVILFVGIATTKAVLSSGAGEVTESSARQVVTAPAGIASELDSVLETTGEVKSQTQGDLRAQRAGVITSVNARVGQRVTAGTIIATIENASERASVAQAQASVAQAQANLNKVTGGARNEELAVLAETTQRNIKALEEAKTATRNTLLSAYATTDAAFSGGIDVMFTDARGANPKLRFISRNSSQATAAEHARFLLQSTIERHNASSSQPSPGTAVELIAEINKVEQEMFKMKTALDNVISALDGAVANASVSESAITSYQTTATSARTSVLSTLSSLSTARGNIESAQSALTIAQENQSQGVTGAQQEDIDVAQAQLESAQASLAQAVAQLENTRVRAPVTGVVTILTVSAGDFVTSFQDIGLIANNNALEIQTYIPSSAVNRITVGDKARINRTYDGVVTSIAPGIDPTKRQVEVHIALVDENTNIPHGSRVSVEFLSGATGHATVDTEATSTILIPISALKLIGDEAFVFIVTENQTLEALPVTLGSVVQSSIQVLGGIERTTEIVIDARGLNVGDTVIVKNN